MRRNLLITAAAAALAFAAPSTAQAGSPVVACSSMNVGISAAFYVGCFNFAGNTNVAAIVTTLNNTPAFNGGDVWKYIVGNQSGDAGGIFGNHPAGQTNGSLTFDAPGVSGWFAFALKAGNESAIYVYNTGATKITEFTFNTDGVDKGKQALSHADFYFSDGTVTGQCTTPGGCISTVPEPSTYALMGAGLLMVGFTARRRRKA